MKNKKMITFVALGALTGAAVSLLDKNVRQECKVTMEKNMAACHYYANHPTELMQQCRTKLERVIELSETALDLTIQTADKAEDMLNKLEEQQS